MYLASMNDFVEMNKVFERYFSNKPARSTVEVSELPRSARVEVDVIAEL